MQKYIIRRTLMTVESREIRVEDFLTATRRLEDFEKTQCPYGLSLMDGKSTVEYIGEE